MDNLQYIKVGSLYWIVQAIPESATGNACTVEIRRLSDGYTWNFSTTQFTAAATTGNMTFINDILWKQSFTPPTEDTYIVTITNTTLDVKYVQVLKAVGAVAQSGVTGSELTTLANLKQYLDIDTDQTTDDTFLQNLITRISDDMERYCQRTFNASDLTEYYKGSGTRILLLRNYPVNSVTSIHDDTELEFGADTAIDSDDIKISDAVNGTIILNEGIFTESEKENIKVVYNAGYSTIPSDLEQACIKMCAAEYIESKGLVAAVEGSAEKAEKLRDQAQKVLDAYRRIW